MCEEINNNKNDEKRPNKQKSKKISQEQLFACSSCNARLNDARLNGARRIINCEMLAHGISEDSFLEEGHLICLASQHA